MEETTKPLGSDELVSAICDILKAVGSDSVGLTPHDIYLHLQTKGVRGERRQVTLAIRQMVKAGQLETRSSPKQKGVYCYHLPGQGALQISLFDAQTNREEIEREERSGFDLWQEDETERERFTASVMEEIARGHTYEESYAQQVRQVAPLIAVENPVNLLLDMVQWVVNDLNNLAAKVQAAKTHNSDNLQRLTQELGFRCAKSVSFFQRLWRLDPSIKAVLGILNIPTISQMLKGKKLTVDLARAKERLQKRIIGELLIEVLPIPDNYHRAAIGTDASVGDVIVEHGRGSFIPPTPAVLFVAAGAMRVRDQANMLNYWDYDLDPRELQQYQDLEAAVEGLLISPHLRREAITDFRHLRSAAMELRQYMEESRIVQRKSKWHPISGVPELQHPPEATLLVRDGRIFPLVHRLDDYDGASAPDDILYGEVVRREIRAFQNVFHNTAGNGRIGAIYSGAVKSPEYSWLAMITFWYLHVKRGVKELADAFYRPPLNDQAVTHLLFWGLADAKPDITFSNPRNMFVTFRAVRRFSDIAFPSHPLPLDDPAAQTTRAVNEDNLDDWFAYIAQHIEEANQMYDLHKRGVPALGASDEYKPFLDLCHRAGVMMFYGAPARMYKSTVNDKSHFFTPRWEMAFDVIGNTASNLTHQLNGLAAWLIDLDGLVPDESHAVGGFDEVSEGLPLFIPNIVMEAHKAVSYGQGRHVMDVQDELQKLVGDIRAGRLGSLRQ